MKIQASQLYTVLDADTGGARISVDDYQSFAQTVPTFTPAQYRPKSLTGFEAYSSPDMPGPYMVGFTVTGPNNEATVQVVVNWDSAEQRPTQMFVRTIDVSVGPSAWGAWQSVQLGNIQFSTSVTPPLDSAGLRGDIYYDTTTPAMWAHDGTAWRKQLQLFVKDQTNTWRNIQQKWVNNAGTWVKVFG